MRWRPEHPCCPLALAATHLAGHTDSGYAAELMEIAADMEVAGVLEKPGADDELCEWAALLLQATENGELEKILAEVVAEVEPTQSKAEEDISMDRAEEEMCEQVTSASGLSLTDVQSPVPPKQELFPSPPTVSRTTTKARPHTRNLWGQCPRPSEAFTAAKVSGQATQMTPRPPSTPKPPQEGPKSSKTRASICSTHSSTSTCLDEVDHPHGATVGTPLQASELVHHTKPSFNGFSTRVAGLLPNIALSGHHSSRVSETIVKWRIR
eukprot:TRINITY_DN311_c0_g1_i2.p1 TRINITY_DN311_c0_g1~~TRINITY_DN311_c0_g1_i2.p1  ORF type:complete len:267 (-),score=38.28 TRINITY_DN311_c0_g1_i2:71-871(-)